MIEIHCTLNGQPKTISVEPGETLLDMIRDRLGMTGTKRGCEVGECGACTVLLDGVPTDSCLTLAAVADGKDILTIEGMANGRELSPLQKAFVEEGAIQCGYCTPGMILTAHALLKKNPNPTREDIQRELAGNMCRCAAYEQIIHAVQRAAREITEQNSQQSQQP